MTLDIPLALYVTTVVLNLMLAVAVGAGMASLWLARGASHWAHVQAGKVRPLRWGAIGCAIVASASLLLLESAAMAEVPVTEAGVAMWSMLTATHLGMAWMVGMAALLVSLVVSVIPVRQQGARALALLNLIGLAIFLYTRSMVSHAAVNGDLGGAMLADWFHLMLISVWVGEVLVAGLVTLNVSVGEQGADRSEAARYAESLSSSATFALVGIFATGLFSAWRNLGSLDALSGNPYGEMLLIKLALVTLAALLGGFNRFVLMPSLITGLHSKGTDAAPALLRFARVLQVEAIVLLAVLIAAAVLSATSPPTIP